MRRVLVPWTGRLAATAALLFLFVSAAAWPMQVLEPWLHLQSAWLRRHYVSWPVMESTTFQVRYREGDRPYAIFVSEQAEIAARQVQELLPAPPALFKPWLVILPDRTYLQRAFGWEENGSAVGVYMANTIKILSPEDWTWVAEEERLDSFCRESPLVHEYTHFVLDLRTRGNYTTWFSEGLAQLLEYKINGYEWLEPSASLDAALYPLRELDRHFHGLDNQPLAYRQSLSLVSFLESRQGMEGINRLVDLLGQGTAFYRAVEMVYGLEKTPWRKPGRPGSPGTSAGFCPEEGINTLLTESSV